MSDTHLGSETKVFDEKGYYFKRLLGEGAYAKVWLASYKSSTDKGHKDTLLACKIVDSKKVPRDFMNKFLPREMEILSKIYHPHLIQLQSIYRIKKKFFIFMRFAEKGDLLEHILAHGEVRESQAKLWLRQLALGLQYLHELEIVHRDIKCENVLITANNNVKLADFGFSRFIVSSSGKRYLSSTYCGSLAYAAPELLKCKPYDPKRSDVWSLGVVLYVMLNQCMPFNDTEMKNLYDLQMSSKWTFRARIAQIVSEEVKVLVRKMLDPVALQRIEIQDVVQSSWFATDEKLKNMTQKETEALDLAQKNKSQLLPKYKQTFPLWEKPKKQEKLVCVTSLRSEQSSDQFTVEDYISGKPQREQPVTTEVADTTKDKSKRKSGDFQKKETQDEKIKTRDSIEESRKKQDNDDVIKDTKKSGTAGVNAHLRVSRTDKYLSVIDILPPSPTSDINTSPVTKTNIGVAGNIRTSRISPSPTSETKSLPATKTGPVVAGTARTSQTAASSAMTSQATIIPIRVGQTSAGTIKTSQAILAAKKTSTAVLGNIKTSQASIAAKKTSQVSIAAKKTSQASIAAKKTSQASIAAKKTSQSILGTIKTSQPIIPASKTRQAVEGTSKISQVIIPLPKTSQAVAGIAKDVSANIPKAAPQQSNIIKVTPVETVPNMMPEIEEESSQDGSREPSELSIEN